jgi:capsule polysaccharide export protein KpsE/RkpR
LPGHKPEKPTLALDEFTVALGADDQAHLSAVLLACLNEEQRHLEAELKKLFAEMAPDRASLRRILAAAHDLSEQADHLLLAIAGNGQARLLQAAANEAFDRFRQFEETVAKLITRQQAH